MYVCKIQNAQHMIGDYDYDDDNDNNNNNNNNDDDDDTYDLLTNRPRL